MLSKGYYIIITIIIQPSIKIVFKISSQKGCIYISMTKYEVYNLLKNYAVYNDKLTFIDIIHNSVAIILNVGIVLIRSG